MPKFIKSQLNFIFIIFLFVPSISMAQWSSDPNTNTPICTATNDQLNPAILSDGEGGAYIVWSDHRSEATLFGGDIYMQRINSSGVSQWTADGMIINAWPAGEGQVQPKIVTDGSGGNIIVWRSLTGFFDGKIYAQRTDSTGLTLWSGLGVPICNTGVSNYHDIIANSTGGALIGWSRDGDIYTQLIDSTGSPLWTVNGIAICTATNNQTFTAMAANGNDGAFIVWKDERTGFIDPNIYAQHISSNGNVSWQSNGIEICTSFGWQQNPQILESDNSTAYIAWHDARSANGDIYAQRIDSSGTIFWAANGVAICNESNEQNNMVIASDGMGGAILAWSDLRDDQGNIYAQRIDAAGNVQWAANGISVCTATNIQDWSNIIPDGNGGAIIIWQDQRGGGQPDLYAQRLNASGAALWTADGVAICTATSEQYWPVLISDGAGGAIISWEDERLGLLQNDIYVQWVDHLGNLGGVIGSIENDYPEVITDFQLYQNFPNPFNPITTIKYDLPYQAKVRIDVYNILGQRILTLLDEDKPAGFHSVKLNANQLASGMYFYTIEANEFYKINRMLLVK